MGLQNSTFDTASSAALLFGLTSIPILNGAVPAVEVKKAKSRAIGRMIADKRTPGVAEIADMSGEIRADDYANIILPRLPKNGGTLLNFAGLFKLDHPSVTGTLSVLVDGLCFTKIEGFEIKADENPATIKFTLSCMTRWDKGADGIWKQLWWSPGQPSATAKALLKF